MSGSESRDGVSEKTLLLTEPLPEYLSPKDFELFVARQVESWGYDLKALEVKHLDSVEGVDGEYVIDVTARFELFGGIPFLCVFECKKRGRKLERGDVQKLLATVNAIGADKGVLVSSSGFQLGAIVFAQKHGLSLLRVMGSVAIVVSVMFGDPTWGCVYYYFGS
jgi:Restriction endonuclease